MTKKSKKINEKGKPVKNSPYLKWRKAKKGYIEVKRVKPTKYLNLGTGKIETDIGGPIYIGESAPMNIGEHTLRKTYLRLPDEEDE